jgi:pre-mRNA-splicing factor 38B
MNLPEAVYKNVRISGFFVQELRLLQTFDEVVNVAKKNIKYCEPWIGQSTNPSALWCVLWKCFKLRLTRRQVESLLRSQQSPYLRALGLLYIRFCALPDTQWELYDSMLFDDEEVTLTAVTKNKCTIGQLTRDLIVKVKIFDIIMPRIPVPIHKRWLESLGLLSGNTNKPRDRDRDRDRSHSPPRARARSRSPTRDATN